MDPRSGKAARTASKAGAATSQILAQSAKGAPTKPSSAKPTQAKPVECPVVPEAVQPNEQNCSSSRASGNQRKKSPRGSRERPQVRARGARTEKAPLSGDAVNGHTDLAKALEPPLPRAGSRRKGGACTQKAPLSGDAVDGQAGLAQEPESPLPRAGSRRKGSACAKTAPLSGDTVDGVNGHTDLAKAPEPPLPRAGSRRKGGACTQKAPLSGDAVDGQAGLAQEPESPLPRAGYRRKGSACAKTAPLSGDTVDGHTELAEGPEPSAAPEPPLPRAGSRRKGGACTQKAPLSGDAVDGHTDLAKRPEPPAAPEPPLPRAGYRRKGSACAKTAPLSTQNALNGQAGLAQEPESPLPRHVSRRKGGARTPKAPLSAENILNGQVILAEGPEPPAAPELPLPRAGSARSSGERRPPSRPTEGAGQDPLVPASSLGRRDAVSGAWKVGAVLQKLKLRSAEISEAAKVVNRVVDHLLRGLKSGWSEFKGVEELRTGSYYEQVKVSAPNEFDIMFKLDIPRIQLEEYRDSGAHYFVRFKRNPQGNPLNEFLEGERLSASKMLSKFRELIKKEIKNIKDTDISVEKKKRGCPAVTLLIKAPKEISVDIILALKVQSSWPLSTQEGMPIENWLGRKVKKSLRLQPFYLVPKPAREGNGFQEETWRLSFSHIEKDILKNHGKEKTCCESNGVKCYRKRCLQLMKYLLEKLKEKFEDQKKLGKFCSYHVKTAFFHVCAQNPHDSQWRDNLELCFDRCLEYFLHCLKSENLEHFFIPEVNLFSRDKIDRISKEFLTKEIEYERNNGFPIFGEF
ncbi:PREDICTED: cyclic GMP-AMP synthase [Myotis davidii]|uniref:Cyclic GMP-AMP synthase n=1 Tax=Myotis davidii TaxID=225400 RepID=L5LDD7_MYODS|nr:PREDICTED: cyclic GMP-AMP synthase [Myotis davidii]ELK23896.1 Protein MB21D1 [Myotis davidii]